MWHCLNGNNAPQGSATAWDPMWWNDQSTKPYMWIGFDNFSPWLSDDMGTYGQNGSPNTYQYWLVFFYYYALQYGTTVLTALNEASQMTGFSSFGSCILNSGQIQTYWPYGMWIDGQYFPAHYYTGTMVTAGDVQNAAIANTVYYIP